MIRVKWWMLLCGLVPLAFALGDDRVRPDPIALHRVSIGPERVRAELERVAKGTLVLLPRAEFEARVQQAALAVELAESPPRLIKTRYHAQLENQALVGHAEWSVIHTSPGPGVLALPGFDFALTGRIKVDAADGILGDLDGKSTGLWIGKPGQPIVHFDWSHRGTPASGVLHFDLQVPICANAQIELTLPLDCQVTVNKPGLLVEGPRPSAVAGQRTWVVSFSGRSRLEFDLCRLETGTATLFATLRTNQQLSPDVVLADYEFDIEALHGGVSELQFDGDSPLQPYSVSLDGVDVKNWQWRSEAPPLPPRGSGQAGRKEAAGNGILVVSLRAPIYGALSVVVRCLAPVASDKEDRVWVSPGLRLRGALSRGEILRLKALVDTQMESWKPGHFRLTKTASQQDGSLLLTLVHGGVSQGRVGRDEEGLAATDEAVTSVPSEIPERPTAVLKARRVEFLLEQQSWWKIDIQGSTLSSELVCSPIRGQLYHLPLKLPPESQVDQISVSPPELLRGWSLAGTRQMPLLLIDFAKPATTLAPMKIELQLRLPSPSPTTTRPSTFDLPDIEPQVPCLRQGALGLTIHPHWQAQLERSSWPATAEPEGAGATLWQRASTDYHFAFRGKPLTGKLRLSPRASQFRASCQSDVVIGGNRGSVACRLTIEPTGGSLDHVELLVSTGLAEAWKVRGQATGPRIVSIQRLASLEATQGLLGLGSWHGLEALPLLIARPAMERWRLVFGDPVRSRVSVVLEAAFDQVSVGPQAKQVAERSWVIPIVTTESAEHFDGELIVQLIGTEITSADVDQLQEIARPAGKALPQRGLQQLWRVFGYDSSADAKRPPSLRVKGRAVGVDLAGRVTCDAAVLTTYVESGGRLMHQLHFRLSNWRKPAVPVFLPSGAVLLAARTQGRWLPSLLQVGTDDSLQVQLPASAAIAMQEFDLYYSMPGGASSWAPWASVAASLPQLPVRPLDYRQTWVMPPGLVPFGSGWQRITGSPRATGAGRWQHIAKEAWNAGNPWLSYALPETAPPSWATAQKQCLANAEAALRRQFVTPSSWQLGQVVEALALTLLPPDVPLVVDAAALAAAGLSPESVISAGSASPGDDPWAKSRLAMVCTPSGLLLTTQQERQLWPSSGELDPAAPEPLSEAVAEAAQRGHDSTGRFCTPITWLRLRPPVTAALAIAPDQGPGVMLPDSFGPNWTQWQPPSNMLPADEIMLVRPLAVHIVGVFLGGFLTLLWGLAAWRMRSPRWRLHSLLAWAGVAGVAGLWLPDSIIAIALWPAAAALLLGGGWFLAASSGRWSSRIAFAPKSELSSVATVAVVVALGLSAQCLPVVSSQGIDGTTVLLLPGSADAPERQDVLVTPDLLKNLESLCQRGPSGLRGAVLLAARYEATVTGDVAHYMAEFQIHSFSKNPTLLIPLGGVELSEGTLLDGANIEPIVAAGGYSVPIVGEGAHVLKLPFTVRVQAGVDHKDLHFTGPRLLQNQLSLVFPAAWPEPQVVTGQGQARGTTIDAQTRQLAVDLGRDAKVQLRWPALNTAASSAKLTVREMYYWDLRSPGSSCTAVLNYSVKGGSVSRLSVALPDMLEPRGVEVLGDGIEGEETSKPLLKEWHLEHVGDQRHLHIQLQGAASGDIVATLHFAPRLPLGPGTTRLPLLLPLGAQSADGSVAYRAPGFDTADKSFNMMTLLVPVEKFTKDWQETGRPDPVVPTRAFSFRNRQSDAALVVALAPRRPSFEQELMWTLHAGGADLKATLKASLVDEDIMLVEWDVPPLVTVAEIKGDNIRSWTRAPGEGRIQIWLKQPAREAAFHVSGWMLFDKLLRSQQTAQPLVRWALPWLHFPGAASARTVVSIAENGGITARLDVKKLLNLNASPPPADATWVGHGTQELYRAEFALRAMPPPVRVTAVTTVENRDGALYLAGQWLVHVPHGDQARFFVRVENWQGPPLKLEGPGDIAIARVFAPKGQQRWQVTVASGAPRHTQLKLTGSRPSKSETNVDLPKFQLVGATWSDHWLAARIPGLELRAAQGLADVNDPKLDPRLPPGEADRLGHGTRLWKMAAPDWKLSLVARASAVTPGLQVLLAEQGLAFGEARGWVHQACWSIFVKDTSEIMVDLPPGALVVMICVDGQQVNPRVVLPERLAVALPPGDALRRLQLRWIFGPETEPLAGPRLASPRLAGMPDLPVNWTVTLPPEYRLTDSAAAREQSPTLDKARQELARAEAEFACSKKLAERFQKSPDEAVKAQVLSCQARFIRHVRLANQALLGGADPVNDRARAKLKDQLAQLDRQYEAVMTQYAGLAPLLAKTTNLGPANETDPESLLVGPRGKVIRWRGKAQDQPVTLTLVSNGDDGNWWAWKATACAVLFALAVLALARRPQAIAVIQRLWPEVLAVLAILGSLTWGWSIVAMVLLLVAGVCRVLQLRSLYRHWRATHRLAMANSGQDSTP